MAQNNQTLTDIAIKRLSGKANTNAKSSVAQEAIGSTVQTVGSTVFGEAIPNTPTADTASHMFRVQSASLGGPGTVMLVDFEIVAIGDEYANDLTNSVDQLDEGDNDPSGNPETFHSYGLILSGNFETSGALADFNANASTPTQLGSAPFKNNHFVTGSRGKLQIVPEYVSSDLAGVGGANKYTPIVFNNTADGLAGFDSAIIGATDPIDYYLDPFSGILFVQDPGDYGDEPSHNTGANLPGKVRCFIYVGKYQDEVLGNVDIHISASGGTGFSLANEATASFESGSAGITVTADSSQTITIGDSSDNVSFNDITSSAYIMATHSNSPHIGGFILDRAGSDQYRLEHLDGGLTIRNQTDDVKEMTFNGTGNVGIGNSAPPKKLTVDGAISASGDIITTGDLVAQRFIISSSISHITQSFSDGSTIFGDTNNDTHLFTGSIEILHTGSGNTGLLLSGSTISVDAGSSGSLLLGTHNVGIDFVSIFPITGSGLIVSQSNLPSNHFNMLKVGDVEFVDYIGPGAFPSLLIDVKQDRTFVISSSNTDKPVLEFANPADGGTKHKLYSGSAVIFEAGKGGVKLGGGDGSPNAANNTAILGNNIQLQPNRSDAGNLQVSVKGTYADGGGSARYLLAAAGSPDDNTPQTLSSFDLQANAFARIRGNVTASAVSSSGLLFASASEEANGGANIRTVVYDTASGQFFFTGSYGSGGDPGDTVDIHFSSSAGGFSFANTATASFQGGDSGVTIVTGSNANELLFGSASDNVTFNEITASGGFSGQFTGSVDGIASSASISNKVQVTNNEDTSGNFAITFVDFAGDPSAAPDNTASLQVDASTLTYNPNAGSLKVGDTTNSVTIKSGEITQGNTGGADTFALLNTNTETINFGGAATQINIGASTSTASFAGNLVVQGTMTSLDVENLLVDDQFILLNSGSNTGDGGIIVQTDNSFNGTALYYDDSESRWAITSQSAVNHADTSATPRQFIVTVSQSNAAPTGDPSDFGNDATSWRGMMYVDTNDSDGDGNIIYIYA